MKIWTYNLGVWIPDSYELKEWQDGHEFNDYLKDNGFSSHSFQWGKEFDENIIFYPKEEDDKEWLADIPTTNRSFYFYIPNHPSFLFFKKEYKHLYDLKSNNFIEVDNRVVLNKNFITTISEHCWSDHCSYKLHMQDDEYHQKTFNYHHKNSKGQLISDESNREWLHQNFSGDL
jgi:hypothetical protein